MTWLILAYSLAVSVVSLRNMRWVLREMRWLRQQREEMAQAQKDFDERIRRLLTPNPTPCDRPAKPLRLVRSGEDDVS